MTPIHLLPHLREANNADVEKTRSSLHAALGRTEQHCALSVNRLEAIVKASSQMRDALQKQLPELAKAADVAVGEERAQAHGNYLRAKDNIRRCDQVYNGAKHELIIARNL